MQPLLPPGAQLLPFPPSNALILGGAPAGGAPGPAAPAPGPAAAPLTAATPSATTPNPDPFLRNTSIVLGEHPNTVTERNTLQNSIYATMSGNTILDFAKNVNSKLVNATIAHMERMSPTVAPVQPHLDNWTAYWTAKRPFAAQWVAPPMTKKIQEWMDSSLHEATHEVAEAVPHMVRDAILRHTKEMVERMRFKPIPPTRPPDPTTTWAPPPAIAPPMAPSAAPAVAAPPGAPGAPSPGKAEDPEPQTLGMGYIKGPNGQYYMVDLDMMRQTTTGPQMIMGPNGQMYAAPPGMTTAPKVMGPDGRMYAVR